jgi:hypothetical protein
MKPLQYVKKYKLDVSEHFDRQGFMADFTSDFMAQIEVAQQHTDFNLTHWQNLVKQMRSKFDGIVNKSKGTPEKWEKTWKYFYATVVVKLRDQLFGEVLAKKKAAYEERKRQNEEWYGNPLGPGFYSDRRASFSYDDFMSNFFRHFASGLASFLGAVQGVPLDSFETLGLPTTATEDEIKDKFRKLALTAHSDKGGSDDAMQELIQARNKCVAYAGRGVDR